MISKPTAIVACDICGEVEEHELAWDGQRWIGIDLLYTELKENLLKEGWTLQEDGEKETYCPECTMNRKEAEKWGTQEWRGG
jgi:hypothetical protein